ncbi:MAG: hypothetical protein HY438_03265 [DPANN group archaeon]|nr:hypothetical protein [DPANN group archaeon]
MSLKNLEHAIETHGEWEKLEQRRHAVETAAQQAELAIKKEQENALAAEKLPIAKKIFAWVSDFAVTDTYKKILAGTSQGGVHIYGGGWGHEVPHSEGFGIWSRLDVRPDGTLRYIAGFKYAGGRQIDFATPEQLAAGLNHTYLFRLWNKIETEEVYGIIENWHFRSGK